jgi:hypothetical protein
MHGAVGMHVQALVIVIVVVDQGLALDPGFAMAAAASGAHVWFAPFRV